MSRRAKDKMSIVTVVSFGRFSGCVYKIAIAHTAGSMVTLTSVGSATRGGTNFTPSPALRRMLELSGLLETEERMVTGDKVKRIQHEN
jgi:hypothetical protein